MLSTIVLYTVSLSVFHSCSIYDRAWVMALGLEVLMCDRAFSLDYNVVDSK